VAGVCLRQPLTSASDTTARPAASRFDNALEWRVGGVPVTANQADEFPDTTREHRGRTGTTIPISPRPIRCAIVPNWPLSSIAAQAMKANITAVSVDGLDLDGRKMLEILAANCGAVANRTGMIGAAYTPRQRNVIP